MPVNEFLLNLALRAAGGLVTAKPEIPAAPWIESPAPGVGLEEIAQQEGAPRAAAEAPQPRPGAGARPVASRPAAEALPLARPAAPMAPTSELPGAVREVRTELNEAQRDVGILRPSVELPETARETVAAENLPQREMPVAVPPPVFPSPLRIAEAGLKAATQSVIVEIPRAPHLTAVSPITRPSVLPAPRPAVHEKVVRFEPARAPVAHRDVPGPLLPRTDRQVSERLFVPLAGDLPNDLAGRIIQEPKEQAATEPPAVSILRPGPVPHRPMLPLAKVGRTAESEKPLEVRIGTIEIRSVAPAPQPKAPEPARPPREPVEGFEQYTPLRRYSAWFRE